MDEALVENWNLMIKPKDIVYHLGDFCFRGGHDARFYTDKLNGKKILIKGNHDKLKNGYYESFSEIHDLFELKVNKQLIVMCHYAMRTWNKSHRFFTLLWAFT
jgi:calcineurin-like phosphoesterase family protein